MPAAKPAAREPGTPVPDPPPERDVPASCDAALAAHVTLGAVQMQAHDQTRQNLKVALCLALLFGLLLIQDRQIEALGKAVKSLQS